MGSANQSQTFEEARAGLLDICPFSSVIWKPLHRLLGDGNPIDPVTILYFDLGPKRRLPFAAISKTRGNRLVLWPPSDARQTGDFATGDRFAVHHITLELANGQTHFTRFDEASNREHVDRGWKLIPSSDGLSLWLIAAFKVDLLERQIGALEQNVKMPTSDSGRRVEEFKRYAATLSHFHAVTPALRGDSFIAVIHLMEGTTFRGPIEPHHFPMGSFWNDWFEDWPDGDNFQIAPSGVNIGGVNLVVLTASPLGRLKGACFFGSKREGRAHLLRSPIANAT